MFRPGDKKGKDEAVERARLAREERERKRAEEAQHAKEKTKRDLVARVLLRCAARWKLAAALRLEFDARTGRVPIVKSPATSPSPGPTSADAEEGAGPASETSSAEMPSGLAIFRGTTVLLFAEQLRADPTDRARFVHLAKVIAKSMQPGTPSERSYVALALAPSMIPKFIAQLKMLLQRLLVTLEEEAAADMASPGNVTAVLTAVWRLLEPSGWHLATAGDHQAELRKKALIALCSNVRSHLEKHGMQRQLARFLSRISTGRRPLLTPALLDATVQLALLPTLRGAAGAGGWAELTSTVFAVPLLVANIRTHSPALTEVLQKQQVGRRILETLQNKETLRHICSDLNATGSISLVGNTVQLAGPALEAGFDVKVYTWCITALMQHCQSFKVTPRAAVAIQHPVLGWVSESLDRDVRDTLALVAHQIQELWSTKQIAELFKPVMEAAAAAAAAERSAGPGSTAPTRSTYVKKKKAGMVSLISRSIFSRATMKSSAADPVKQAEVQNMVAVCRLFTTVLDTLEAEHCTSLLSAIAFSSNLVPAIWNFLPTIGARPAMSIFLDDSVRRQTDPPADALATVLALACQLAAKLVTTLSNEEIYEKEEPLSLNMLCEISQFLNDYVCTAIWSTRHLAPETAAAGAKGGKGGASSPPPVALFGKVTLQNASHLLSLLYDQDCRQPFTPKDHWLVTLFSTKEFEAQFERELAARRKNAPLATEPANRILTQIPHVLPHLFRVRLFRDVVVREKSAVAATRDRWQLVPHLTIRRAALLADGFREVSRLGPEALKDTIRIKFVNDQGLDEAGIDEMGLFKEFLEETVKQAFDPDFGLFTSTADNKLYPNPKAKMVQPQYLELFEFVGKMLGKAVYEGHLMDLPFAPFFINLVVGRTNTLNELAQLDPEVSRNLQFVKTYEGNVEDLDLFFAVDDELFGKVVTTPLKPGGESIAVTNSNRIEYCHRVAMYKLNTQISDMTRAFSRGFRAVVGNCWVFSFSAPDIQRLISGDNVGLDVDDLKRHVQYIGGYSSSHRVIKWLWQIVSEMNAEEQGKFLKFVTSCSKPPVLGFQQLAPAFTIRCVTDDSHPDAYSLGGALVNMFRPGTNTERLPTASTCFNLLKLPLYKSKKVLRDKLLYSLNAGAGFELS